MTDHSEHERDRQEPDPEPEHQDSAPTAHSARSVVMAIALFALTFWSTTYVGAGGFGKASEGLWSGLSYSVPLMFILLCHEFGHYIAARIHRVPASLPFFVPLPIPPLGTMGAIILMPGRIARRNALLDIGAAGPLAGLAAALPILIYGIATSPVLPLPAHGDYQIEGRSVLYLALLRVLKGPIPDGFDVFLTGPAFAGWAGLLVTMLNLIPAVQLDGGHVAYALFGERQERYSRRLRAALLPVAALIALAYGLPGLFDGAHGDALLNGFAPGMPWFTWWILLGVFVRLGGGVREHPQTDDHALSPRRRIIAWGTLLLFLALFMPAWLRQVPPS